MAKRYGRNQRRKHREEIAALLEDNLRARSDYQLVSYELREKKRLIDEWDMSVNEYLGAYSAFLINTPTVNTRVPPFVAPIGGIGGKRLLPYCSDDVPSINPIRTMSTIRHEVFMTGSPYREDLQQIVRYMHVGEHGDSVLYVNYTINNVDIIKASKRDLPYLAEKIAREFQDFMKRGANG